MKHYTHFSLEEREKLSDLLSAKINPYQISKKLSRSPSSITREIERNSMVYPSTKNALKEKVASDYVYRPWRANDKYHKRRMENWWRSPLKNPRVFAYVLTHLKWEERWSPDIISGMLKEQYPDDLNMRISHECIYQFIYSKRGKEEWENRIIHGKDIHILLKSFLLRAHRTRRKYGGRSTGKSLKASRSLIREAVDIEMRLDQFPKCEWREEIGHWEWDSIVWVWTGAALHTQLERFSRYLMVAKLPQKTAEYTQSACIDLFRNMPMHLRKTDTFDNGCEFTRHREITRELGLIIYFAKPYHSWERWGNENANGMIRRYFPKWTNFDDISETEIQRVVDLINNRPRKILGYKTAKQVFEQHI